MRKAVVRAMVGWVSLAILTVAAGTSAEGLENSDFEQPGTQGSTPTGWQLITGNGFEDSQKHHGGQYAFKIDGGSGSAAAFQDVTVTPGAAYQISGYWRNGDKTADFDVARVEVLWYAAPGHNELSSAGNVNSGAVVSDWTPFRLGPLVAPPSAGAARIRLMSSFGIAAFDDIKWEQTEAPAGGSTPAATPAAEPAKPAATPAPATPTQLTWHTDIPSGQKAAAASGSKTLLFFASPGNDLSDYFEKVVLADSIIQGILSKNYACIRLDYGQNAEIAKRLQATQAGMIILYDAQGQSARGVTEKVSVEKFQRDLEK